MRSLSLLLIALGAAACSGGVPDDPQVTAREASLLVAPEPGARAADYHARTTALKLFGVQATASGGAYATVADTSTWVTRNVRVGDHIGRNLQVTRIDDDGVELTGPDGTSVLRAGQRSELREVRHQLDEAVQYRGKHRFAVDPALLGEVGRVHGHGMTTAPRTVFGLPGLELTNVEEGGAFAALGFERNDVLLTVDGKPATASALAAMVGRLSGGETARVRMSRRGTVWEASFERL